MSDAGRKMDVEDVLSSIRRLVSEEARTAPEADKPDTDAPKIDETMLQAGNAKPQDKLVLTPSLRVSEAIAPPPIQAEIEQRIADIESLVMSEAVATSQAEIAASIDVQDATQDAETPPRTSSFEAAPMAQDVPNIAPEDKVEIPGEKETAQNNSEMMAALNLSMRDFARAEPPLTANLSSAPAEESDAKTAPDTVDDDQPTDSFDAEVAEFYDIPAEPADDAEIQATMSPALASEPEPEPEPEAEAPKADLETPDSPFTPEDTKEAPAPVFIHAEPVAEPKETPRDPMLNREPPLTSAAADPEPKPILEEDSFDLTEEDDTFLDEETLREMVSDMVRSELQGELGDRITRNVRKLVRREIYRALASRDFE